MKTLYDLLGALPDDDAESLRAAFRRAAKANHPDRNPDDPDAPLRFRQIVRANAILSDERQRATYDQLLEIALRQPCVKPKRGMFSDTTRRAALDTITGAALSVGLVGGGYLLLVPAPKFPLVPAVVAEMRAPEAAQTALVQSAGSSDTVGRLSSRDKPDDIEASKKSENLEIATEASTPGAIAPPEKGASPASSPNIPQQHNSETNGARYYQERGISAYRSGDLSLALADFDLAISLDPGASDAYIDRAIVFHRMGNLKRAFADISEAKRIDDSNLSKASPANARAP
jgi:curved DNA-binding protein CbpA